MYTQKICTHDNSKFSYPNKYWFYIFIDFEIAIYNPFRKNMMIIRINQI